MRKILHSLWWIGALMAAAATAGACDLCGCYTPQIDAMLPAADPSAFGQAWPAVNQRSGWLSHTSFAVAEQFTYFATLQFVQE